ncbi:MAG: hypothetical protein CMJ18_04805, partial [Phycisphaeraceae bacterium]|nr:hypothetical protein [Phycisphaeraceae bacterium]
MNLELLEPRLLLTTLFGGEVFEFRGPDPTNADEEGPRIRIAVEGDATIEIVAADIDDTNSAILGDLPGVILESDLGRTDAEILGGVGGQDGIELIGDTPIIETAPVAGTLVGIPNDDIGLQALATNDQGQTFAINFAEIDITQDSQRQVIQVAGLSNADGNGTVQTTLHQATVSDDIMRQLSLTINAVEAFAVDPDSGLAYVVGQTAQGPSLFEIDRATGTVTFVGPITTGGFSFDSLGGAGMASEDLVGLASDADDTFFSIFDTEVLNNGLFESTDATTPIPVRSVNDDPAGLGGAFDFVALAVGANEFDDTYAIDAPAAFIGTQQLFRIPRDNGATTGLSGATLPPVVVGVIQDGAGNLVTGIQAADLDEFGLLFVVGTRPAVNGNGEQELFRVDVDTGLANLVTGLVTPGGVVTDPVTALAFNDDNELFISVRIDGTDTLMRVETTFNALPSESTALTLPGSVSASLVGFASFLDPADDDHGKFFSLFDDNLLNTLLARSSGDGDTDGDGDVDDFSEHNPVGSVGGDLGTNDFNFVGLAVNPDDAMPAFAINNNGGTLELVRITRRADGSIDPDTPPELLGEITDARGNTIAEIAALDTDGAGVHHAVGFNIDAPVPTVSVGGDLGADFDFVALTIVGDSETVFAIDDTGPSNDLYLIARDPNTGEISGAPTRIQRIRDANNESILSINALESDPVTGQLFVIGTTGAGPEMELFEINPITAIAESRGTLMEDFDGNGSFAPITDLITGLAIRPSGLGAAAGPPAPEGDRLVVTPTMDTTSLTDALLEAGGTGLIITDVQISGHAGLAGEQSAGTFVNPSNVYSIDDGVVLSTGDVADYGDGPNLSTANFTSYNQPADAGEEALLDPITGGALDHFDVTQLDITFDLEPGFDSLFYNIVWGTEEFDEFVGSPFIDAFGMYVNGVNVAQTGGFPVNVDHPDMAFLGGTELDGILAPGGNPVLTYGTFVGNATTDNTLTFIIADTGDAILDSTAFISGISGAPPVDMFAVVRDTSANPGGVDRLVQVGVDPAGGSDVSLIDLGLIEIDEPAAGTGTTIKGIDFTSDGDLLGNDFQGPGLSQFVAINTEDGTMSTRRTDPLNADLATVSDDIIGLAATRDSRFLALWDDGPANDEVWISPNELFPVDTTSADLDGDGDTDEVQATRLSILNVAGGAVSTDTFAGLAFDPATDDFFGVEHSFYVGEGEVDEIFTIDPAAPIDALTPLGGGAGRLEVLGNPTDIIALDVNDRFELIAVNDPPGDFENRHLVRVDQAAPELSVRLTPLGSMTDNASGFSFNDVGIAHTLFDREVMNDALLSGLGDHVPAPVGPFQGATDDLDVVATAVLDDPGDPDDGRVFVVHDVIGDGTQFELYEVLFLDTDGDLVDDQVDEYSLIGVIQNGANDITDIEALEYDRASDQFVMIGLDAVGISATNRQLFTFAIGSAAAASVNSLSDGAPVMDTINALAFDAAGTLYGVRDDPDRLITVAPDGSITVVGLGAISVTGKGAVEIGAMDFTVPDAEGDQQLLATEVSGGGAQVGLLLLNVMGGSGAIQPNNAREVLPPGTISGAQRGLSVDSIGRMVAIIDGGAGPDALGTTGSIPLAFVNGDLDEDLDPLAVTVTSTGATYTVIDNLGVLELHEIVRDADGEVTDLVRLGDITDASGIAVTNILALDANPTTDELYAIGLGAPVPAATVGGDLGDEFDIAGLDITGDAGTGVSAIARSTSIAGEDVVEQITIARDPVTGAVTGSTVNGEIRQQLATTQTLGNRIVDIDALEGGFLFGWDADGTLPNANVGEVGGPGALIGDRTFDSFIVNNNDEMFAIVDTAGTKQLFQVVRDSSTNAVSQFNLIGDIQDPGGTDLDINVNMLADDPLDQNRFYAVATVIDPGLGAVQELFSIDVDTAVGTSIGKLFSDTFVTAVYDNLIATPNGTSLLAVQVSDPGADTVFRIDPATAIVTTVGSIANDTEVVVAWDYNPEDELLIIQTAGGGSSDGFTDPARRLVQADINGAFVPTGGITNLTNLPVDGSDPNWQFIPGQIDGTDDLIQTYAFTTDGRAWGILEKAGAGNDELWISGNNVYTAGGSAGPDSVAVLYQGTLKVTRSIGGVDQSVAVIDTVTAQATSGASPLVMVLDERGIDRLVTLGAITGTVGEDVIDQILDYAGGSQGAARIQISGAVDTALSGLAFNQAGQLIGLNTVGGLANHLVLADQGAPGTTIQLTPFGSADPGLNGFSSDINSRFYSINTDRSFDELWINSQQLFRLSTTPVDIGDNDGIEDEIVATSIGSLDDGVTQVIEDIPALAWRDDGTALFGVRDLASGQTLITIDPVTAEIGTVSEIVVGGTAARISAMDINIEGRIVALDDAFGPNLRRLVLISIPEDIEVVGPIMVDSLDTRIEGFDFTVADSFGAQQLVAVDDSLGAPGDNLRRLIEVLTGTPNLSLELTAAGTVSEELDGFSSDGSSKYYAAFSDPLLHSALYVSNSAAPGDFSPVAAVNRDLQGNFDFTAVTVALDDRVFAVDNPSPTVFDLYQLPNDKTEAIGATRLGRLTTSTGVGIVEVDALETNPATGLLTFVGKVGS